MPSGNRVCRFCLLLDRRGGFWLGCGGRFPFGNHHKGPGGHQLIRLGRYSVDGERACAQALGQLGGGEAAVLTGHGGDKVHPVSRVDQGGGLGLGPVDLQASGQGGLPVKDGAPSIHLEDQRLAASAQQVEVGITVHHQQIHSRQIAAAEELGPGTVEGDLTAVADKAQSRRHGDAQRRGILRVLQGENVGKSGGLEVTAGYRHPLGVHIQGGGDFFSQAVQLAAAAGQKQGGGGGAIDIQYPLADLFGQQLGSGFQRGLGLLIGTALLLTQNVGEGQGVRLGKLGLHLFCGGVVHQVFFHQGLSDLVACHGGHGVAHYTTVPAHGDIRGARPNVYQTQV